MNKRSSVFVWVFLQPVVFVWGDAQSDQWSKWPVLNYGPEGCSGTWKCPLCRGFCESDEDCSDALVCFQRNDDTPIFGCKGGTSGDVPGYSYCAYSQPKVSMTKVKTEGTKGTNGCLAALHGVIPQRGHREGFNLMGCFRKKTEFTVLTGKLRENFEVEFLLSKTNIVAECKKQCASFCYMAVGWNTNTNKLSCSCSNSPTWMGSTDAVLGAFKCSRTCPEKEGGCGGASSDIVQSVWSNGDSDICVKRHEAYWARPLSPGKFCSTTSKKKCSSSGSFEEESSAMSSPTLCREKCEEKPDCGGYTSADSGKCTLYGWSDDLKLVDSVTGGSSGVCDHSTPEEFSLIGCFPKGDKIKYGLLFRETWVGLGSSDLVGKCKKKCMHTCYMGLLGTNCFCSDDPQIGVPFVQTPDAYCSHKTGCNVQYGCGDGPTGKYMSVYSNNQLRSSKCRGKPIWGKTCSYEVGKAASGVTFKSIRKTSAELCQLECENDRRCGCFTYMPGVCQLKPKGISCGLKSYKSSCAFVAGTCSNSELIESGQSSMSISTKSVNFAVMGKMKIQNADGGYLSTAIVNDQHVNTVSETCGSNVKCEWEFEKSRLSREGFVAWDIRGFASATQKLYVHVEGVLKGLEDKNQVKLQKCINPRRECSWVLEPIPGKKDYYYIRTSGGNTYLRKNSNKVSLDKCTPEVAACQWKVKGPTIAQPEQPDVIASHLRYSVRLAGTKSWLYPKGGRGTTMQAFPCDTNDGKEGCYWYFEKSAASTGGQNIWYIKTSSSKAAKKEAGINYVNLEGTTPKLGACSSLLKKSPYRERKCGWILEPKGDNKYKLRSVVKSGYLQVAASKAQLLNDESARTGFDVSYGTCTDEAKCTWELTGVFPNRVAFDLMEKVKISNFALTTGNMYFHAAGAYDKKPGTNVYKSEQTKDINAWTCTNQANDISWKWRCHYTLERHEGKDSNVWYIKQWSGRINSVKGPEVYVSVPSDKQQKAGVPKLGPCKKVNGKRPEECQWVFEPVTGSVDELFLLRNVAVSKKTTGKNLYLRKKTGSSQTINFQECSVLNPPKECQWRITPSAGFEPLCMHGPVKRFANIDIKDNNIENWEDKSVDECNALCYGTKTCVGFVMAPYGKCWLKKGITFDQTAPATGQPRDSYMLTGSFPACNSPQSMKEIAKVIAQPQPNFLFDGCVDGRNAPNAGEFQKTNEFDAKLAVGACMEICRNFCVMMLGWNNKCVCSNAYPTQTVLPLGHCGVTPFTNGQSKAASVFVNMGGDSKCSGVVKPPVSAAEKGIKQCSVTVGMGLDWNSDNNNRAVCIDQKFTGGYFFDATGTHFDCAKMQESTAEECAGKCAGNKDCAGYMFDKADAEKKKWSCALFKWGAVWEYKLKEKHVTGTCDEKPVDPVTVFGCFKKADLTAMMKYYNAVSSHAQCVERCGYTCYMGLSKSKKCTCANELPSAAKKYDLTVCNSNCLDGPANGCGDTSDKYVSVYANNVLRSNKKCEKKIPWRRSCTKKSEENVLGDNLANGVEQTTAGACHQNCESNPDCGCYKWDPADGKCYQKKTKTAAGVSAKQCSTETHEGMFQLVSGTCK